MNGIMQHMRTAGVAEIVAQLPIVSPADVQREGDLTCGICYTEYGPDHVPHRTACHHIFCRPCIERWILNAQDPNCPLCRGPFLASGAAAQLYNEHFVHFELSILNGRGPPPIIRGHQPATQESLDRFLDRAEQFRGDGLAANRKRLQEAEFRWRQVFHHWHEGNYHGRERAALNEMVHAMLYRQAIYNNLIPRNVAVAHDEEWRIFDANYLDNYQAARRQGLLGNRAEIFEEVYRLMRRPGEPI